MNAQHRILSEDVGDLAGGGSACYVCGMHSDGDGLTYWPCLGPQNAHPAYVLSDGTFETCAAHPYGDCELIAAASQNAHCGACVA